MSRLAGTFAELSAQNRKALVTFITAGDPHPDHSVGLMQALVAGGADVLELGIPFSDPEAEGPAIQASSERALAHGVTLRHVLDMVRAFRTSDTSTPVVLMGYLNSVLRMGEAEFARAAAEAGCDGLIMVNLPPEAADTLRSALAQHDLDLIFLLAPTTTDARAERILDAASGFAYYVSLKGVTGADNIEPLEVQQRVRRLRERTKLPVMVGFGIKDGASAASVGAAADGVVVGSALVRTIAATPVDHLPQQLEAQVRELRAGLDGGSH